MAPFQYKGANGEGQTQDSGCNGWRGWQRVENVGGPAIRASFPAAWKRGVRFRSHHFACGGRGTPGNWVLPAPERHARGGHRNAVPAATRDTGALKPRVRRSRRNGGPGLLGSWAWEGRGVFFRILAHFGGRIGGQGHPACGVGNSGHKGCEALFRHAFKHLLRRTAKRTPGRSVASNREGGHHQGARRGHRGR